MTKKDMTTAVIVPNHPAIDNSAMTLYYIPPVFADTASDQQDRLDKLIKPR